MPRLQQLRYLVAIADTLNFGRAAEACDVTQPTLSMQLKELEANLGAILVERTRSRVLMTPVGADVVRRARDILAAVEDIREIARGVEGNTLEGSLRMGVVQTVGAYVLSLAMPRLRRTYPKLRVLVREDRIENLPAKLSDGTHEVLLMPHAFEHPEATSVCLLREPLHLVLPADHRLAAFETIDPEALAGETVLTMERGHRLHDQIAALCQEVGANHAGDYAGTTLDTLRLMVTTGMGITLLPALYVRSDVVREKLVVARPLSSRAPVREITMVWRSASPRAARFALLADGIRASLQPWGLPPAPAFGPAAPGPSVKARC